MGFILIDVDTGDIISDKAISLRLAKIGDLAALLQTLCPEY